MAIVLNGKKLTEAWLNGKKLKEAWLNGRRVFPDTPAWTFQCVQTMKKAGPSLSNLSDVKSFFATSQKGSELYVKEEFISTGYGVWIDKSVYENPQFKGIAIAYNGKYYNQTDHFVSDTPYFMDFNEIDSYYDLFYQGENGLNGYGFWFRDNNSEIDLSNKTITIITRFNSKSTAGNVIRNYFVGIMKVEHPDDVNQVVHGEIIEVDILTSYSIPVVSLYDGDLNASDFMNAMNDSFALKQTGVLGQTLQPQQKRDFWKIETFPSIKNISMYPEITNTYILPQPSAAGYEAMEREGSTERGNYQYSPYYTFDMEAVIQLSNSRLFYNGYILNAGKNFEEEGPWECYVSTDASFYFTEFDFVVPGRDDVTFDLYDLGYEEIYKLNIYVGAGIVEVYTTDGDEIFLWEYHNDGSYCVEFPMIATPCSIDAINKKITDIKLYVT